MNSASRPLLLLLALLATSCELRQNALEPLPSALTPRYVEVDLATLTSRVSGLAWDPEALWFSFATCGGPACPELPILIDTNPLMLRSIVRNARVVVVDADTGQAAVEAVTSSAAGTWTLPRVPSRPSPYFFISVQGEGELPSEEPPGAPPSLPQVPPASYLPTVTLRPLSTRQGTCMVQEAIHASNAGILDAVARHLTLQGQPTTVADLIDPSRYAGVTVVWLYRPGFSALRVPAFGTTVTASAGTVLNVTWAPPGTVPPEAHSPRGFVVARTPDTFMGIAVVLIPASEPVSTLTIQVRDLVSDAGQHRPWKHRPLQVPVLQRKVGYASLQLITAEAPFKPTSPHAEPPYLCLAPHD
jgi:hypothetical protein